MKVLFVIDNPDERDSGTLVLDICRNASRFGIEASVAAFDAGDLEDKFEFHAAAFHRLESEHPLDINSAFRLRNVIRERQIDVVHCFGPKESVQARIATLGHRRIKRILHLQDLDFNDPLVAGRFGLRSAARVSDAVLLPTRDSFSKLRKAGIDTRKNFFFCPPGIDADRVRENSARLRDELGIKADRKLLGMIAPFDQNRSYDQLTVCESLAKALNSHKKALFVFAGAILDEDETIFEECVDQCESSGIGKHVYFVTDKLASQKVIASLDALIFSASGEIVPLAVMEAMITGVPIVVPDTDSMAEITDGGKLGHIFVRGDSEELASRILSLIKSKKLRERRAVKAMEFASSNYSIEKLMLSLNTLYSELVPKDLLLEKTFETKPDQKEKKGSLLGLE